MSRRRGRCAARRARGRRRPTTSPSARSPGTWRGRPPRAPPQLRRGRERTARPRRITTSSGSSRCTRISSFAARLRFLVVSGAPVSRYRSWSTSTPQIGTTWGRPSGVTVPSQYAVARPRRSTTCDQSTNSPPSRGTPRTPAGCRGARGAALARTSRSRRYPPLGRRLGSTRGRSDAAPRSTRHARAARPCSRATVAASSSSRGRSRTGRHAARAGRPLCRRAAAWARAGSTRRSARR